MTDIEYLKKLKDIIEQYDQPQHIDILKILMEDSVNITTNLNGSFINLTEVNNQTIKKLQNYINFINIQNIKLTDIETTTKDIESSFFKKKIY